MIWVTEKSRAVRGEGEKMKAKVRKRNWWLEKLKKPVGGKIYEKVS